MNYFFIEFTYEHYCQGYETERERLLVQAIDFSNACRIIGLHYKDARDFKDFTLRETNHF